MPGDSPRFDLYNGRSNSPSLREKAQEITKESQVVEGHLMPNHVHMCFSIPPKYAVSNVVG